MKTGVDKLGSQIPAAPDLVEDYVQPDTQIEPSIAVNPANPKNVVAVYQEGRIADGGDATNGYGTSTDGGKAWKYGELRGLTTYPGQGGLFERASDAVVAFGPGNLVYANSLVFDFNANLGLRSGIAINVSKDGGLSWGPPVIIQDDNFGGLNDKNWIVVDMSNAPGHHYGRVYVVWDRIAPVVYDYCDHDCDRLANWLPSLQTIPGLVFPGDQVASAGGYTSRGPLPRRARLRERAGAARPEPGRLKHARADGGRQGPPAPERLGRARPAQALKNCVRGLRGMPRT